MSVLRMVIQLALGLLFLMSFIAKIWAPRAFLRGVKDYEILPPAAAHFAGAVLIPVEGFLAAAHLTGSWLVPAILLSLATLAGFAIAVAINLRRRRLVPCHCFDSSGGETISARTLLRLCLMAAGELVVLAGQGLTPAVATGPDLSVLLLAVLLLAAMSWFFRVPELWALFRRNECVSCGPPPRMEPHGDL